MDKTTKQIFWLVTAGFVLFYIFLQSQSIYGGDAGDLVTAAYTRGIAHPPGYPLYTLLGWLLTRLPFSTVAWRVTLLSSLPTAFSLGFLFLILKEFTRKNLPSLISTISFGFLYPVWLYASVPEVFALHSLFVTIIIYFLIRWWKDSTNKYLYLTSFVFGLALAHHHTIVLLTPAIIFLLIKKFQNQKQLFSLSTVLTCFLLILAGLLPYLYLPLVARTGPALNWGNPLNFSNFWRVITRADYGTFTIGSQAVKGLRGRFLNLIGFFILLFNDFRPLGIFLLIIGIIFILRFKEKTLRMFWLISLISTLLFIFYSGFPLNSDFITGTFERFILIPYYFLFLAVCLGLTKITNYLRQLFHKNIPAFAKLGNKSRKIIESFFLIFPLSLLVLNFPKISILKNDFTAEYLSEDILKSLEKNALLISAADTSLFNTQYVYYIKKIRPDVKLVHLQKLQYSYYLDSLKKFYPDLQLPDLTKTNNSVIDLLVKNSSNVPIYLREPIVLPAGQGEFAVEGLVFRYYPRNIDIKETALKDEAAWKTYHNPLSGSLGKYRNLLLSDVLRVYALNRQEAGIQALKAGFFDLSLSHFQEAIKLYPADPDAYLYLGQVLLLKKDCQAAENAFFKAVDIYPDFSEAFQLLATTYKTCFHDQEKATHYQQLYDKLKEKLTKNEATPSYKLIPENINPDQSGGN